MVNHIERYRASHYHGKRARWDRIIAWTFHTLSVPLLLLFSRRTVKAKNMWISKYGVSSLTLTCMHWLRGKHHTPIHIFAKYYLDISLKHRTKYIFWIYPKSFIYNCAMNLRYQKSWLNAKYLFVWFLSEKRT